MLRFKQFLLTETNETLDYKISGVKNQNQNLLNLVGLSPERRKELEKIQSSFDDALKNNDGRLFDALKTQLDNIEYADDIDRLRYQNTHVRYDTGIDTDIDTKLPPDLQKLQRNIRATKVEKAGFLPPHEEVTRSPSLSTSYPTSSDLEELEKMGVVDAKNYRPDERGVLYRPGPLPSEEERRAKAIRATDAANVGGGSVVANTPEAKEFRSNALRDYYARTGKAVGKTALLKMVPFIGTAASLAAMGQRAQAGDYVGAGLEAASEVADYIPGVGTAASMGIQGYLADRDMSDEERKEAEKKAARQALRSMNVHSPRY